MAPISTLLVDDNNDFLRAVMDFLALDGRLQVVGLARSGREAIEQVALMTPALVLMDWAMPEMDGLSAARHIKGQAAAPCIIMMTHYDTASYRAVAAEAGVDDFVAKSNFGADLLSITREKWPELYGDDEAGDASLAA